MVISHTALRDPITSALCQALEPLPSVLAGWEGGSAALDAIDEYSDIDLIFLVQDNAVSDELYAASEVAITTVSLITCSHLDVVGCHYKLEDGGDFFLVDLCFIREGAPDRRLDVERHGRIHQLFDKGDWLRDRSLDEATLGAAREKRRQELQGWFSVSQSFVRKAIIRGQVVDALAAFWGYTLRPLVELLRMRYCPLRWDFGMRYLDRDLPQPVFRELQNIMYVKDPDELSAHLEMATGWGVRLLQELESANELNPTEKRGYVESA
jgi:hypothetical protein